MFISFLNPQGNFDSLDSHWASHPDFGGQLVYVKELALEMAELGHRVDIVTRRVEDKNWPEFKDRFDTYPDRDNIRIVRIDFGPAGFLEKEKLWPYICPEYVENLIKLYKSEGQFPDFVTSHYGDGGLAGAYFNKRTGIPFTFTAHSLGAQKMDKIKITRYNIEKYNNTYNFATRLTGERISMNRAHKVITSTTQERFSQYTHTAYSEAIVPSNEDKFAVIPPGVSLRVFDKSSIMTRDKKLESRIKKNLKRDLNNDRLELPSVISSSRLDPKKNIAGILKAYGSSSALRETANLVIVTRGYNNPLKNYQKISEGQRQDVLKEILSLIDSYNLRGKVSMFSIDSQKDLSGMYRYFASTGSVFCLAALYEPFGLAPLEAMACGLPVVTTKFGGPAESLREAGENFGLLIDPTVPDEVAGALFKLTSSFKKWKEMSNKGYKRVLDKYTWRCTAKAYLNVIKNFKKTAAPFKINIPPYFTDPKKHKKPSLKLLKKLYLQYDILCIGETMVDFISDTTKNSLLDSDKFTKYPGGNPAYVSVYAAKLSKKAILITKLGTGHFGEFLIRKLQEYGVCTEHISFSNSEDTSVAFLTRTPSTPDFQSMRSADSKLNIKEVNPLLLEDSKVIHTSLSSMITEPARSAIRKAFRIGKSSSKILSLEPNYHPQLWHDREEAIEIMAQICDGVTMVFPSLSNARHLFDYNMDEEKLKKLTIEKFHRWGAKKVIFTAGDRYIEISTGAGKKTTRIKNLKKIDIVDFAGGGSAFISGFIVAYMEKLSLKKCARFGYRVAETALKSVGPFPKNIFRKDILEKIN